MHKLTLRYCCSAVQGFLAVYPLLRSSANSLMQCYASSSVPIAYSISPPLDKVFAATALVSNVHCTCSCALLSTVRSSSRLMWLCLLYWRCKRYH
jgi:hypothetical protein